jgi:hypothetical protein
VVYDNSEQNDNAVYIGTDIGVFYRDNSLTDWIPYRNGLPTVPVFDMYVSVEGSTLYAGTFGRGLWSTELYSECPSGYILTDENAPETYPKDSDIIRLLIKSNQAVIFVVEPAQKSTIRRATTLYLLKVSGFAIWMYLGHGLANVVEEFQALH